MTNRYIIKRPKNFDISQIFDCGQCFRFNRHSEKNNTYCGVAFSEYLEVTQTTDEIIFNTSEEKFKKIWSNFFDLETDYEAIISSFKDDKTLYDAGVFSSGIRILRQDPWETLCSFIISQNNNIPRIKGIIERMSQAYGKKFVSVEGNEYFAFPSPEALVYAGEEAIFQLKTGFRAKYIYDCAKKITNSEINISDIYSMTLSDALNELEKIKGVGPKVASCTLLFGFAKHDAFPIDVWVKKILQKYYSDEPSRHFSSPYAGIAQQYLFYYERCLNNVYL